MILSACLVAGEAAAARAQSTPDLRGPIDEEAPPSSKLAATALEIGPVDPPAPPPRKRDAKTDPYGATGIGTGGIVLYPSLTVGSVYSSNVASSPDDPDQDAGLQLRPSFRFESDWVRHAWTGSGSSNLIFYADRDELNARDLNVAQNLRLDVRRGTEAEIAVRYVIDQSGTGDNDVPATATGYRTEHTLSASAGITHDFGPASAEARLGVTGRLFEDVELNGGGTEDNADRTYAEPSLSLRATYTDPPVFKPYAEASYTPRIHNLTYDRNGLRRDSQGIGLAAGVELDAGPLWTGEIGLTYLHRNYEDSALDAVDAIGLTGSVTWSPAELTRIIMSAGTSIAETTSATQSGNPSWTAGIDMSHALRDNFDISAGAGIEIEDIGAGTDKTVDANIGLSWKFNPVLSWSAGYDFTWLDAADPGRDYTEHRLRAGVTISR